MKAKEEEALSFDQMALSQAIVQVQFNASIFLPTVIRQFWKRLRELLSKPIKIRENDNEDGFRARYGKGVEINIGPSTFGMTDFLPQKDLKDFIFLANALYLTAIEVLNIEEIRRVGFRVYYTQEFADGDVLADALLGTPHMSIPEGLSLHGSELVLPTYLSGYTDGAKTIAYRIYGKLGPATLELPLELAVRKGMDESIECKFCQSVFDVDVFIRNLIQPSELLLDEWIEQAFDSIQKDALVFFPARDKNE